MCFLIKIHSRYKLYPSRAGGSKNLISVEQLNQMKFFISSNTAIKLKSVSIYRYAMLPKMAELIHDQIEEKLANLYSISLMADGWTSKQMTENLGNF